MSGARIHKHHWSSQTSPTRTNIHYKTLAVFKQKYDVIVKSDRERTYTVRLRIIYNGHSMRLMHDPVTVIIFTLITIVVHQNLWLQVWHWLLLSSREL